MVKILIWKNWYFDTVINCITDTPRDIFELTNNTQRSPCNEFEHDQRFFCKEKDAVNSSLSPQGPSCSQIWLFRSNLRSLVHNISSDRLKNATEILTPTLSGFEILNDAILKIQNEIVCRLLAKIFYCPNFFKSVTPKYFDNEPN